MYRRDKTERGTYLLRRRHPRIQVLVMSNVHGDKTKGEGVYDVGGVDKDERIDR